MSAPQKILFIVIDQLRADCLTGDLAAYVDLPNMRSLMADGVTFTRHFSVANPCGPSRASILTGQYAMNHRSVRNGTPLAQGTPNLATELRRNGHQPLLFGYTDTSLDPRAYLPDDPALTSYEMPMPGFDEVVEMRMERSMPWRGYLRGKGYAFADYADLYRPAAPPGRAPRVDDPAIYAAEDSDTAFLTDSFLSHMADRTGEGWFAHLTYIRPHPPLVAPAPYNRMVDPATLPLPRRLETPADEAAQHPFFAPSLAGATPASMVHGLSELTASDANVQALRAVYLGLAAEVDHHIGRVSEWLKRSGQYEDTLIVLTADHGEMLGDRHAWGKMNVHDAAFHTPLIVRLPGASRRGVQVDAPTESIDIAPTILEWTGAVPPNSMDGHSLLPLLRGDVPKDWRSCTYSELDFGNPLAPSPWQVALGTDICASNLAILREEHLTLVEFAADTLPPMLLKMQGGLARDVAHQPEHAVDLARMTRTMLRHRMRHMDQTLALDAITASGPQQHMRH
jgi:arylsulfatase A-like enzyme